MRAVAYQRSLPAEDPLSLQDVELPDPRPGPRDLLVEVRAVSVNPVDTKQRRRAQPASGDWAVLGYDAVGIVGEVGAEVTLFAPGERVWYAGSIKRPGCDSELHVVDERIVARAPRSLDDAAAAAMPLTSITAYELLFDRLGVPRREVADRGGDPSGTLLVVGAGGGVGSMAVQLARRLTDLTVIATASRQETSTWVRELGAHEVLNHARPLAAELNAAGLPAPDYVLGLTHTDQHFDQIAELIAPQGRLGLIDDPAAGAIDVLRLKPKSVSLHWESMFTRSSFGTADMSRQHDLLAEVADLVDAEVLRSTLAEHCGAISAENLRRAHVAMESGRSRGKIVLEGF